jgi:hypothetical protein
MRRQLFGVIVFVAASAPPAFAQLDPLLFLKDAAPHIIFAVDTSPRMQRDAPSDPADAATSKATSFYYDPFEYARSGAGWEATLGIPAASAGYRRKYYGLNYVGNNAAASSIRIVTRENVTVDTAPAPSPAGDPIYVNFEAPARLAVVRAAMHQAIAMTIDDARFGLVKMRQTAAVPAAQGNTGTINVPATTPPTQSPNTENGPSSLTWTLSRPTVGATDNGAAAAASPIAVINAADERSNEDLQTFLARGPQNGGLIPAGNESGADIVDAPINNLLADAKAEAMRLIDADQDCTNTIVVLLTGGGEGTTSGIADPLKMFATTADGFLNVRKSRRVPIYVIAIAPPRTEMAQLKALAAKSGGAYTEITKNQIDAALAAPNTYASPIAGTVVVPEIVAAINAAVQHGFADYRDFNTAPTAALPLGSSSEFPVASPVIGSVNLDNAVDIAGVALPDTVVHNKVGKVIPQRSNVMLTAALTMPGANASLRAFRQFRPVADPSRPSGYRFSADGTPLWLGKVPSDPAKRNLYTAKPDGTIIPFNTNDPQNLAILAGLMNASVTDAAAVVAAVRGQPLGAILDSTPVIMAAPSLDPPPDDDYRGFADANKNRRSLVWVGTNAGILEAIDARLGIEVWGFIPLNLLPKLKAIRLGQGLTRFQYFVDGSPKVAEVKIDGTWRTHLVFGEGPGGTFYQSLDVTLGGMAASGLHPDDDSIDHVLAYFADASRIPFNWAFPRYSSFDPALSAYDGNVNATVPIGDLSAAATEFEKSVGQSWSDPAVGQVASGVGPYAVFVGSGFLPYTTQQQANRAGVVAGTTLYVLSVKDGSLYDSVDIGSDSRAETIDDCSRHLLPGETRLRGKKKRLYACAQIKNALQSDAVATGRAGSRAVTTAYLGDLDGMVWRFDIGLDAGRSPQINGLTRVWDSGDDQPIFSSLATVNVGGAHQYLFFGTGSDLLPSTAISTTYHIVSILDEGVPGSAKPGRHPPRRPKGSATGRAGFDQTLRKSADKKDDEKVTAFPAAAGDMVFFTTTLFRPGNACKDQVANLYAFTFMGGPAYDSTGDGMVDGRDGTLVKAIAGERATAPFIVDKHLMFATASKVAIFGDPDGFNNGIGQAGVRVLSWREVR